MISQHKAGIKHSSLNSTAASTQQCLQQCSEFQSAVTLLKCTLNYPTNAVMFGCQCLEHLPCTLLSWNSALYTYRKSWSCSQRAPSSLGVFTCGFSLRKFLRPRWNCWRRRTAATDSTGLCGSQWMDYAAPRTQT